MGRGAADTCFFLAQCRCFNFAGGSPADSHFSCSVKKSNQKKAAPPHRPLRGFPALLAQPGGCATRVMTRLMVMLWAGDTGDAAEVCADHTVLADFPRPRCATRRLRRGCSAGSSLCDWLALGAGVVARMSSGTGVEKNDNGACPRIPACGLHPGYNSTAVL